MENPASFVQTLEKQALASWNAAPDEVRNELPNLPTLITAAGTTAYTIYETKPIIRIAEGLNPKVIFTKDKATYYVEVCSKTNSTINKNPVIIIEALTTNESAPKEICDKICASASWAANTILIAGLLSSGLQLTFNYIAIRNICNAINESGIAIQYSKDKIKKILERKDKIPVMIQGLCQILEDLNKLEENCDQKKLNRLQNEANFCKEEINEELEDILKDICNLELHVSGRKIRLQASKSAAISGAISGIASGASGIANVAVLQSAASPTLVGITVALAVFNFCCSGILLYESDSANKVLEYIEEQLNAITQLKESVVDQQKEIKKLAKRIFHVIRQLTM